MNAKQILHYLLVFLLIFSCTSKETSRTTHQSFRQIANDIEFDSHSGPSCQNLLAKFIDKEATSVFYKKDLKRFLKSVRKDGGIEVEETLKLVQRLRGVQKEMNQDLTRLNEIKSIPAYKLTDELQEELAELDLKFTEVGGEEAFFRYQSFLDDLEKKFASDSGQLGFKLDGLSGVMDENEWRSLLSYYDLDKTPWDKIKRLLSDNMLNLSPMILFPVLSVAFDGGLSGALIAAIKVSAGIKGLDMTLDHFLNNASKVISPGKLAVVTASTTNLPELGASQASALAGDASHVVMATPLGSNPMNFFGGGILSSAAFYSAVKGAGIKQGIVKRGQRVGPVKFAQIMKKMDLKAAKKELGFAGFFVVNALIGQFVVAPAMKMGNYLPLAAWLTVNLPFLFKYFKGALFDGQKLLVKRVDEFSGTNVAKIEAMLKQYEGEFNETSEDILKLAASIKNFKGDKKTKVAHITEKYKEFKEKLASSESFRLEIEKAMGEIDNEDFYMLMKYGGIDPDTAAKMPKFELVKAWTGVAAGIAAIVGLSILLDDGVNDLIEATPNLGKSEVGFYIVSALTSIGDVMVAKKFIQMGNITGGVQNIAFSNALNLALAKLALSSSFFVNYKN
jgi:Ca2+/Na+ antiporter